MPENALQYFMGRRQAAVVRLLEQNEDVSSFIQALLEHLVEYADKEGLRFGDIKIDRPFITNDGVIKGRLVR